MTQELIHKLLKYLTQGAVIYLLFKYVPKTPMQDNDILIITSIILLVYVIAENFYQMYVGVKPQTQQQTCACNNNNEGFDSVSQSDMSSIGSAFSNSKDDKEEKPIKKTMQGQQQMQQAQSQMGGQTNDQQQNQTVQSTQTIQVPQISYPAQTVQNTQTSQQTGYVKNTDGSYIITNVNPVSQKPFSYNYTDYNSLPVNNGPGTFEYGYSFLPPSSWYPTPAVPPVCVPSGPTCPVCPIYTEGTNLDLKEWNASLSVTPTEQINLKIN